MQWPKDSPEEEHDDRCSYPQAMLGGGVISTKKFRVDAVLRRAMCGLEGDSVNEKCCFPLCVY